MRQTIRMVGDAIKTASQYLPLRNHAASLATLAKPKDYLGQVAQIFQDAVKRWRYVNDPFGTELVTYSPEAIYRLVLGLDGKGVGRGYGAGDCDCISAAMGAQLLAIGRPVRIAVTAPPGSPAGSGFTHIFVQTKVPKIGWVTVDPVVHPRHGLGYTTPHSRIAYFGLDGQLMGHAGNATGLAGIQERGDTMQPIPDLTQWTDYGLGGVDPEPSAMPADWRMYGLGPQDGLPPHYQWGMYADTMGLMSGEGLGLAAEVDVDLYGNRVLARTPMLELDPSDYRYIQTMRRPYPGMMALGDDGTLYEYDGTLGFFKKLFRKAKKAVKRVAKRVKRVAKKIIKKIPGGKYLLKLGEKVYKIAKKIVRPLMKFVGKYAAKLAPVAALIPGYGPAIAGALYTAGKVAKLMTKYGVKLKGKKGTVRKLQFKTGSSAKKFKKALSKAAKRMKKKKSRRKARWA